MQRPVFHTGPEEPAKGGKFPAQSVLLEKPGAPSCAPAAGVVSSPLCGDSPRNAAVAFVRFRTTASAAPEVCCLRRFERAARAYRLCLWPSGFRACPKVTRAGGPVSVSTEVPPPGVAAGLAPGQFLRAAAAADGGGWLADNAMRLSAALSLYTILSLAPLLVITIKVVGVVLRNKDYARKQITSR